MCMPPAEPHALFLRILTVHSGYEADVTVHILVTVVVLIASVALVQPSEFYFGFSF